MERILRGIRLTFFALVLLSPPIGAAADEQAESGAVITSQAFEKIIPGRSTKTDVEALFGAPWRIVQFNDCGMAMDDQADETWEYRDASRGKYRIHIEFDENDVVHLIAKIPDISPGGASTPAKVAPMKRMNDAM
jgi:hypothetical protein